MKFRVKLLNHYKHRSAKQTNCFTRKRIGPNINESELKVDRNKIEKVVMFKNSLYDFETKYIRSHKRH